MKVHWVYTRSGFKEDIMFTRNPRLTVFFTALLLGITMLCQPARAAAPAAPDPLVREGVTVKVSDHVYVIPDANTPLVPNVGIVVGSRATLVVDTGLGARNGEAIMREVNKVSRNNELYLVATHFHPEHLLGIGGFPATTKLLIASAQQADIDEFAYQMRDTFSQRSAMTAELLKGAEYRKADVPFDRAMDLDLGGVRVQMMWVGPTHTRGDTVILVEQDRVLFTGDVVMKDVFPAIASPHANLAAWLTSLDRLESLQPAILVPSHGEMGDASLIGAWRGYFQAVTTRTAALKSEGKSVDEAATQITTELTAQFPGWRTPNRIAGAVRAAYNPPAAP